MRSGPRGGTGRRRDENVLPCRYPTVREAAAWLVKQLETTRASCLPFAVAGSTRSPSSALALYNLDKSCAAWLSASAAPARWTQARRQGNRRPTHQCGELPDYFEVVGRGQPLHCRAAPCLFLPALRDMR